MARQSVNSLKGKIWLATSALAFFICAFGTGSYLIFTLFVENSFYIVLIRFMLLGAVVVAFGWWLANEVVRPIEKVTLLAKSFERGVSITLPKTSGAAETDELLQTLHRNNQQLQNLVGLMEKVAGGNFDVALAPLQQSDRLSNSFQKLLAKVTESISAKQELERLKQSVGKISEKAALVRNGNFDIDINSDFGQTKEISETFNYLIHRLNELIHNVKGDSKQAQVSAKESQKIIQIVIGTNENRIREMNQAMLALKQIPQSIQKISQELFTSSHTARQSIERAQTGARTAQDNLSAASVLRQQIRESVKRVGRLGERTQEIGKVAKIVEDLAQRTNMIALNASIQTGETGGQNRGFIFFTEEVERLAERASDTNKQIAALNKTMSAEIGEIERSLNDSVSEAANISKFAIETGNSLSELEKYIGQFLNLQDKLVAYSGEQSVDAEKAFESFVTSIAETENGVKNLKESELQIAEAAASMENLQTAVADFKTLPPVLNENAAANEVLTDFEPEFYT